MPVVGRLDQYASMLCNEFDDYSMSENLFLYSEQFDNVYWTNFNSTDAANTGVAPDGTTTADTLIPNVSVTDGLLRQNVSSLADNTTYTFSVFLKTSGLTSVNLQFFNKANTFHGSKTLNLSTGVLSGSDFVGTSSVISYGNGWYRLILTNLGSGTGATTPNFRIVCTSTGNGTSGIYVWGAQLETGLVATDYTPTTTTAVNRVLPATTNTNITGLGTYYSSGFDENVGFTTFLSANIFAPYDPVYDEFSGTLFGAGQGRYMRQNTDKSVIVYNEIDEVTDLFGRGIVRDGLVLDLDAGNTTSYVGSGTTWTDLSPYGNNGTLVNGPTYSSANGGSIVFDGSNDYVTLPTNLLIHETGNPFTFSIWFKTSSTGIILGQTNTSNPTSATGYVPAIYVGTNGLLYTSCFWGGAVSNQSVSSSSVNNGSWNNITVTFASNSQISYLNGVSYATLSKTQTSYSSTYYYFLGSGRSDAWDSPPGYFNGSIATTSYYNRALSATEITQNFDALRGRYGLSAQPVASITGSTTSVNEGSPVTFSVASNQFASTLYWTINAVSGTVDVYDFGGATSGSFSTNGAGSGSVALTLVNDGLLEGTESFQLQVRTGSTSGTIIATSSTVTVNDTSILPFVTPSTTNLNEGSTVTFSVASGIPSTTLYWTLNAISGTINTSDFTGAAVSGSFSTDVGGNGSVALTLANDATSEGTESFQLQVRTVSTSGTIIATSPTVTVSDPITQFTPGLAGKFFNGSWRATIADGNIGTLPLTTTNDSSNITGTAGLPSAAHRFGVNLWPSIAYGDGLGENYGFIAIGYFTPPTTGTYTIFTSSDDGSGVWIGDLALAGQTRTSANATLNNGMGLGQGNTKRSGTIALTGGVRYPIRIVMEEASGGDNLTFSWSGPGISETTDLLTYFSTPTSGGALTGNY